MYSFVEDLWKREKEKPGPEGHVTQAVCSGGLWIRLRYK